MKLGIECTPTLGKLSFVFLTDSSANGTCQRPRKSAAHLPREAMLLLICSTHSERNRGLFLPRTQMSQISAQRKVGSRKLLSPNDALRFAPLKSEEPVEELAGMRICHIRYLSICGSFFLCKLVQPVS